MDADDDDNDVDAVEEEDEDDVEKKGDGNGRYCMLTGWQKEEEEKGRLAKGKCDHSAISQYCNSAICNIAILQ